MHTVKINDINFDKIDKNWYVILGNQVQFHSLKKILGLESFYFYTEYLGSNLIDFSGYSQKNVQIDGLDFVVHKSKKWL